MLLPAPTVHLLDFHFPPACGCSEIFLYSHSHSVYWFGSLLCSVSSEFAGTQLLLLPSSRPSLPPSLPVFSPFLLSTHTHPHIDPLRLSVSASLPNNLSLSAVNSSSVSQVSLPVDQGLSVLRHRPAFLVSSSCISSEASAPASQFRGNESTKQFQNRRRCHCIDTRIIHYN